MATNDIPVSTIKAQPLTNTPNNSDTTIMDDTVILMDGTGLMGGPVAISQNIKASVKPFKLFTKLPRSS